ncbi:sulfotransferase [soil metagenome]
MVGVLSAGPCHGRRADVMPVGPGSKTGTPAERPIFLIGCARSGTTLLRLMLDSHPAISCGGETKFLVDLERTIERYALPTKFDQPRQYWLERLRAYYAGIQLDYMHRRGKRRWADKTPLYTLHLPLLEELFPHSQYVHLIRDGRDVVASTRDRWGYRPALGTAWRKWTLYVRTAQEFGRTLPAGRYHDLRYEHLVADPEPVMRRLFDFLGEAWDPRVLDYQAAEHDGSGEHYEHQAKRRRESSDERLIYRSRVHGGRGLDPLLAVVIRMRGGALLHELGYR